MVDYQAEVIIIGGGATGAWDEIVVNTLWISFAIVI